MVQFRMKTKVSVIKCESYKNVKRAVAEAVEKLGISLEAKKVLIKPNVLGPYRPEQAVTTHPDFIRAVCELFDKKTIIYICDSSGTDLGGYTKKALEISEIKPIEKEFDNVKVMSFDSQELEKIDSDSKLLNGVFIPKLLKEVDLIINLPKLKTHTFTQYTGAVKNLFGCIPGTGKARMHKKCENAEIFSKMLLDLHDIVKPNLSIMDGVLGMEGNGPNIGDPKWFGVVLASENAIALDMEASRIIGFKPGEVLTNRHALNLVKPDDLVILGDKGLNLSCKKPIFAKTFSYYLPKAIRRSLYELELHIDVDKCKRCKICYKSCPVNAIDDNGKRLKINHKKCIGCHCCHELCPYGAVEFKGGFLRVVVNKVQTWLRK